MAPRPEEIETTPTKFTTDPKNQADTPATQASDNEVDIEQPETVKANLNSKFAEKEDSETDQESSTTSARCKRNHQVWCCFGAVAIIAALVLVIVLLMYNPPVAQPANDDLFIPVAPIAPTPPVPPLARTKSPTAAPTANPTAAPVVTAAPTQDFATPLIEYLETSGISVGEDGSAASQAVDWLVEEQQDAGVAPEYNDKLAQRFAILALDFGMTGTKEDMVRRKLELRTQFHQDECLFEGVACNEFFQITSIRWGSRGLTGIISSEIAMLTNLKYFEASNNALKGSLPDALYNLDALESLYLYKNQLSGSISSRISNLFQLTHVHLSHNQLSGSIPEEFESIGDVIRPLRSLNLYSNQLTGTIPNNLRWRKISLLDLGRNQLTGTIPEMEKFVKLRHLSLDHNKLTGIIPESLIATGNGRLESLHLNDNALIGGVPGNHPFSNILVEFTVENNSLTQPLDKETCNMAVWAGGEMVEMKSDCEICNCKTVFCQNTYCS